VLDCLRSVCVIFPFLPPFLNNSPYDSIWYVLFSRPLTLLACAHAKIIGNRLACSLLFLGLLGEMSWSFYLKAIVFTFLPVLFFSLSLSPFLCSIQINLFLRSQEVLMVFFLLCIPLVLCFPLEPYSSSSRLFLAVFRLWRFLTSERYGCPAPRSLRDRFSRGSPNRKVGRRPCANQTPSSYQSLHCFCFPPCASARWGHQV